MVVVVVVATLVVVSICDVEVVTSAELHAETKTRLKLMKRDNFDILTPSFDERKCANLRTLVGVHIYDIHPVTG